VSAYFFSFLAAAGVIGLGAASGAVRSAEALPTVALAAGANGAGQCSVKVIRTGAPGAADVIQNVLPDGSCQCVVTTGPASANGAAEDTVTGLMRDRQCANAPKPANEGANVADAAKGASFGPASGVLPVVLGGTGAGGLAATLGNASNG